MSQLMHIQFAGLDESADPKALPPGTLLVADNCRMDKQRRLHKRWGTASNTQSKVGGGSVSAGARLFEAADGGVGMVDGSTAYVYAEDAALWKTIDAIPALNATKRPLVDSSASVNDVCCALSGNLLVTVWLEGDVQFGGTAADRPVYAQVQDVSTWATVMPPTLVDGDGGRRPRVVINGTKAVFFYRNNSGELKYRDMTLSTFAMGTATNVDTGLATSNATCAFDVYVDGTTFYLAYVLAAGTDRLRMRMLNSAYTSLYSGDTGGTAPSRPCIRATSGENGYCAWHDTGASPNTGRLVTFTPANLTITVGPTDVYTASSGLVRDVQIERVSSTHCLFTVNRTASGGGTSQHWEFSSMHVQASDHAVTTDTLRTTYSLRAWSRLFQVNSKFYILAWAGAFGVSAIPDASVVVVEVPYSVYTTSDDPTHPHVATLENQTGGAIGSQDAFSLPDVPVSSNVAYAASYYRRDDRDGDQSPLGCNINRIAADGDLWRAVKLGDMTLHAGAAPVFNDGQSVFPYGFVHPPFIKSASAGGGGTGSMAAGAYQYACCFVRLGPNGVLQRSALSNVVSATAVATGSVTLSVLSSSLSCKASETLQFSNTPGPVMLETYRTEVGGSVLYKLTVEPWDNTSTNIPITGLLSLTDTRADADIVGSWGTIALSSQPNPYTDTEVDDIPPPAFTTVAVHRNRFVGIDSTELTLWFSKDASEDLGIAPGFNEVLTLQFSTRKKALASLDEKLIVFGEDGIDAVFGDGPDSLGDNNTWQISRVHSDVGCVNPRSVVVTPFGVAFESRRGLEMLDRGLSVAPLGQQVEDTLAAYPEITSAVLVAEEGEVRWTCNNSAGTYGVVVVWDYVNKAWFVRKYRDAADTDNTLTPFVDAALIGGTYTMLTAGGQVYQEDVSTFLDDGTDFVARDVQIAHVSPAGPSAWCRYRRWQVLGTNVTDHDLKLSVKRDYASSWEQDNTFAAETTPTTVGPIAQARITPQYQKATAMAFRLQDATPSTGTVGTGAGPIWEALTLEYDVKRSTARTAAAEQA